MYGLSVLMAIAAILASTLGGCLTDEEKSKSHSWTWDHGPKTDSANRDTLRTGTQPPRSPIPTKPAGPVSAPPGPIGLEATPADSAANSPASSSPLTGPGTSQSPLYVNTDLLWPENNIPVCWINPDTNNFRGRQWVQEAVTSTWQRHSPVTFSGWDRKCPVPVPGVKMLRIIIEDTPKAPHTKGLGVFLAFRDKAMSLNFTFRNWCPACRSNPEKSVKAIAVHEFGHALGFAHEQNRGDTPQLPSPANGIGIFTVDWCSEDEQGTDGVTPFGGWDISSVMNYCNPRWAGDGTLSPTDIAGVRYFYGTPRGCPSGKFSTSLHRNCSCFPGTTKQYEGIGNSHAVCKGESAPNCPHGLFSTTAEYKACKCLDGGEKVYHGLFDAEAHCTTPALICPEGQFNTLGRYYDCRCPAGSDKDYYDPTKIFAQCKNHIRSCPENGKFETIGEYKGCECPSSRPRKVYYGIGDFYGECRLKYCPDDGKFSTTGGHRGCQCPPEKPTKHYFGIFDSEAACK